MIFYQKMNSSIPFNVNVREYEDDGFIEHLHRDFELIYVKEGKLNLRIEDKHYRVNEGNFALVLQNEVHSFSPVEHSKIWVMVFSEDYVRCFSEKIKKRDVKSHVFDFSEVDKSFLLKNLIFGELDELALTATLSFVCSEFYRNCTSIQNESDVKKTKKSVIHEILAFISEHYTEDIRLSDLADALGYEEHYLSRIFNATFGKRFTVFVNEYRIYHARRLISDFEDKTLAEVASESGFGSVRNFNRVYKIVTGKSPKTDKFKQQFESSLKVKYEYDT